MPVLFKDPYFHRKMKWLIVPEVVLTIIVLLLIEPNDIASFLCYLLVDFIACIAISYIFNVATGAHLAKEPHGWFRGRKN